MHMIFAFVASSVELDKHTYASDSYARLLWFAMETKGEPTTRCLTAVLQTGHKVKLGRHGIHTKTHKEKRGRLFSDLLFYFL